MNRLQTIREIEDLLWECDDEYLNTWLMEGTPDGADDNEVLDITSDAVEYELLITLAAKLLIMRKYEIYRYIDLTVSQKAEVCEITGLFRNGKGNTVDKLLYSN